MQPNTLDRQFAATAKRPLSVDGVRQRNSLQGYAPSSVQRRPASTQPTPRQQSAAQAVSRPFAEPIHMPPTRWERMQMPVLVVTCMIAGFFVQSLWFGIGAVVLYAILSAIFRVPSRVTFTLAFMSLLTVIVLLLLKPQAELASNFATYTFMLLVTGVIALSIEARPQKRRKRRTGR